MAAPFEIVLYVHGVSQSLEGRDHDIEYGVLHHGIARRREDWPGRYMGVEWGWNHTSGGARSHELLTDAQRVLGERVIPAVLGKRDFTLNPGRVVVNKLRPLTLYGFGDVFYYVSTDGKRAVRSAVVSQIVDYMNHTDAWDQSLSLTLLGHSAGSVVAFDFLFFLFFADLRDFVCDDDPCRDGAIKLRQMAQEGRLRVRRLVTFGSPITMLACRSDAVLRILAANGKLQPRDYGLTSRVKGGSRLEGPRWINLWDKDDPIAWPVEPLMATPGRRSYAEDIYVDVSDSMSRSHDMYWRSDAVQEIIARRW
jgi:hypothetical protein